MDDLAPLPAASSLLSSRWSRDNPVTGHPAQLYDGTIQAPIDEDGLVRLIRAVETTTGALNVSAARRGVLTWDVACTGDDGPFTMQVPLAIDGSGTRGRARRDVPGHNVQNMRAFTAHGLCRFVSSPIDLIELDGEVVVARLAALPDHHPLTFGRGALHVELAEGRRSWLLSLGPRATAELLVEMTAALVYHYEPDVDGGTALTDVFINDGDFVVARRRDGSFDLRMTAARRRQGGIGPDLLLLYLIQMMAYEDWLIDGKLVGLPTLAGNPSVAFAGVVRGVEYRCRDLGQPTEVGHDRALGWIRDFGRSRLGRAYRPWVERFLAGRLPPTFGDDPRERWWRLVPIETRLGLFELGARLDPTGHGATARDLRRFVDRVTRELGRSPDEATLSEGRSGAARVNDLGREELEHLLDEAKVPDASRADVAEHLLARWPYRGLDHLLAQVPVARALRRLKGRLSFGRVVVDSEQGTLASLGPPPAPARARTPSSEVAHAHASSSAANRVANPETFDTFTLPPSLHAAAARAFPSFEAYMDAALHDSRWGYYARRVSIGRGGHFITNPESLSPHYGAWVAARAFTLWRDMLEHREIEPGDGFPIVEFGAGNGRLARDVLDAVARNARIGTATDDAGSAREHWQTFAERVVYRIYETSPSLRERQRALLRDDAVVSEGDARHPSATLARDFPAGVKGLVLTNEVPDAFGVHKVVLMPAGVARAALVIPRVKAGLREALRDVLRCDLAETDAALRRTFGLTGNAGDLYLDRATWVAVMTALATLPDERRDALLGALWFEETYVPVDAIPELAAHLAANAMEYESALAADATGVVAYVNVHAARFIRELGASVMAGFIVTIDYGDTTWGLVQGARRGDFPFRVYGDQADFVPRPNDPYSTPGTQDLTADVNFSDLAQAGRQAGLHVVHYGPERDLIGGDLPTLVRATTDDEVLAEFLGNRAFKVLVLGTRATDAFGGPYLTPLPLFGRTFPD